MSLERQKSANAKILEELLREEGCKDPEEKAPPQESSTATGPSWHVEDPKATPFVSDFFLSHRDKVLGI